MIPGMGVATDADSLGTQHPGEIESVDWRRDFLLRRLLAIIDAVAIIGALFVAASVELPTALPVVVWGFVALPMWTLLFKVYGLYERDQKRVSHGTFDDLPWLFHAVLVGTILLWGYFQLLPGQSLPGTATVLFAALSLVFVTTCRFLFRQLSHVLLPPERVLFLGAGPMTVVLATKMHNRREFGLEPIGCLTADDDEPGGGLVRLGNLQEFERIVREDRIDRAVITSDAVGEHELMELARIGSELGIKLSILPAMHDVLGPSVEVDAVEGITVLGINPPQLSRSSRALKRAVDLGVVAMILPFALPVMAVVAVVVKLGSPGPVLFRQRRIGRGGRQFEMLKFRTMVVDAEALRDDLVAQSKDQGWLHLDHDPRVTRNGKTLRHLSLDELPQLWNVLKGEMSVVGPRPLIEDEDRNVEGWGRRRLDLTPGVTGMWQVLGRTEIPFDEMVKLDYLYVTSWSLWRDIKIIVETLPALARRRGVN